MKCVDEKIKKIYLYKKYAKSSGKDINESLVCLLIELC